MNARELVFDRDRRVTAEWSNNKTPGRMFEVQWA